MKGAKGEASGYTKVKEMSIIIKKTIIMMKSKKPVLQRKMMNMMIKEAKRMIK